MISCSVRVSTEAQPPQELQLPQQPAIILSHFRNLFYDSITQTLLQYVCFLRRKTNFLLAILEKILYTNQAPAGVMELGSDATAACGGVKGAERVAAVYIFKVSPNTAENIGHRNRLQTLKLHQQKIESLTLAGVMELVDVVDSKSTAGDIVPVRVRSPAPKNQIPIRVSAFLVPVAGLEPARCRHRWILSPLRLPIPSHRQVRE